MVLLIAQRLPQHMILLNIITCFGGLESAEESRVLQTAA
jgi:hypothetical protein